MCMVASASSCGERHELGADDALPTRCAGVQVSREILEERKGRELRKIESAITLALMLISLTHTLATRVHTRPQTKRVT
jgi:hypothetical protein